MWSLEEQNEYHLFWSFIDMFYNSLFHIVEAVKHETNQSKDFF